MAGKALVDFQDFVLVTNERVVTGPEDILSEATKNTYLFGEMMNAYDSDVTVQSGKKITDRVQFKAGSQFGFYQPNETFSPILEDLFSNIEVNWRFAKDLYGWTDHEIELNVGSASGDARYTAFKKLKKGKEQGCEISIYNGMESALWATPNKTTMENANGTRPYSIRAIVTEDGLGPWAGNLMGVDPSLEPKWRNQIQGYAPALIDTQLVPAFEQMYLKLEFKSPKKGSSSFTETNYRKFLIATNTEGRSKYVQLTREANDNPVAAGKGDLGWALKEAGFGGIDVERVSELDNVGYSTGQPRFFWLNFAFLFPVMHGTRWMYKTDPMNGGVGQPYTWVVYTDSWYNLFCRSRRRQGIVVPV